MSQNPTCNVCHFSGLNAAFARISTEARGRIQVRGKSGRQDSEASRSTAGLARVSLCSLAAVIPADPAWRKPCTTDLARPNRPRITRPNAECTPNTYEHQEEHPFLGQRLGPDSGASAATVYAIETEARQLLRDALTQATRLVKARQKELARLQQTLCDKETLEKNELIELLQQASGAAHESGRTDAPGAVAGESSVA